MSEDQGGVKKKLFGWVQNAIGKLESAMDDKPAAAPAPQASARPATGPLGRPGPAPGSGPLGAPGSGPLPRANTAPLPGQGAQPLPGARAAQTGRLVKGSDSLVRSTPTPPAPSSGPLAPSEPKKSPEEAAEESSQRMGFIIAYMNDPASDPMFQDKQLVYKVVTEERSYQQNRIVDLTRALEAATPGSDEAAELDALIATARNRQGQLFTLLKRLTGVRGKTGGTGFLGKPADDTPPDPVVGS